LENDVFLFGLILSELVVQKPAFPKNLTQLAVAKLLIARDERPTIPVFVLPTVKKLIHKC
jgi:hypothetical protein